MISGRRRKTEAGAEVEVSLYAIEGELSPRRVTEHGWQSKLRRELFRLRGAEASSTYVQVSGLVWFREPRLAVRHRSLWLRRKITESLQWHVRYEKQRRANAGRLMPRDERFAAETKIVLAAARAELRRARQWNALVAELSSEEIIPRRWLRPPDVGVGEDYQEAGGTFELEITHNGHRHARWIATGMMRTNERDFPEIAVACEAGNVYERFGARIEKHRSTYEFLARCDGVDEVFDYYADEAILHFADGNPELFGPAASEYLQRRPVPPARGDGSPEE